jgi:hypothetical protein
MTVLTIEFALAMEGRYNESGSNRLKSILLLPRTDWFVMIAVALSDVESNPGAQCEMEFQIRCRAAWKYPQRKTR